jgi:hypothetical protein
MTPIIGSLGAGSSRGFGRIFKGFAWNTEVLLTTVETGNWTKPANVTAVQIECWGGGGGGGGCTINDTGGSGGAGGSYARSIIVYSTAQQSISYSVAAGGVGSTGVGTSGQNTTWDTNVVIANGGVGGDINIGLNITPTIATTTGSVGQVIYKGGDGESGSEVSDFLGSGAPIGGSGGGGGGGAGSEGPGKNGSVVGSGTTPDFGGNGGAGTDLVTSGGLNGFPPSSLYSGGGGGAAKASGGNRSGASGSQGLIRVRYFLAV